MNHQEIFIMANKLGIPVYSQETETTDSEVSPNPTDSNVTISPNPTDSNVTISPNPTDSNVIIF